MGFGKEESITQVDEILSIAKTMWLLENRDGSAFVAVCGHVQGL